MVLSPCLSGTISLGDTSDLCHGLRLDGCAEIGSLELLIGHIGHHEATNHAYRHDGRRCQAGVTQTIL